MSNHPRVLLWHPRPAVFGGHVVQLEMTAHFLSLLGVPVRISREARPDLVDCDLVHGFDLEDSDIRDARKLRIPVCLSVIYWSKAYRTGLLNQRSHWQMLRERARIAGVLAAAAATGRHGAKCEAFADFVTRTKATYESADLLLPNSQLEADDLVHDLGVTTPYRVVPNAVDPARFDPGLPWGDRSGVLYVGRLEPRKNQLGLIRALQGTGIPLTIAGVNHPHHPDYAGAVHASAGRDVRVVGEVTHEELVELYGQARVHAIPSEFETTGLVSLEASICGCNIVTTDAGYAREYFGDLAWYCSPHDPAGIRRAVSEALGAPPQLQLRERVLNKFTWEQTAATTLSAYNDLLAGAV